MPLKLHLRTKPCFKVYAGVPMKIRMVIGDAVDGTDAYGLQAVHIMADLVHTSILGRRASLQAFSFRTLPM